MSTCIDAAWLARHPETMVIIAGGGYADRPGSGPEDKRCQNCKNYARVGPPSNPTRHKKCQLLSEYWKLGMKSNILARAKACSKWEPNDLQVTRLPDPGG